MRQIGKQAVTNRGSRTLRRVLDYIKTLAFFIVLAWVAAWFAMRAEVEVSGGVVVLDGDSLIVDGQKVRLKGVDAPELSQLCQNEQSRKTVPCGRIAKRQLAQLVSQGLLCKGWEFDKYQRLLAVCFSSDVDVNAKMVEQGWAVSYGDYQEQEANARKHSRGIWATGFEAPETWRKSHQRGSLDDWLSGLKFW